MDEIVFLFDVDNTLLDNDRIQADLRATRDVVRAAARDRYWAIFEELFAELGYADYLGALQRYRVEDLHDPRVLGCRPGWSTTRSRIGSIRRARRRGARAQWGPAVVLSDGDAVFQPRKVQRSGIGRAFGDRVLIYIHKEQELDDVERLYPARRYVMIDDKLRILGRSRRSGAIG